MVLNPFPKRQILDSSKLKKIANNNFEFQLNGAQLSKWVQNRSWLVVLGFNAT